jgi:hypothetical protein
MTIDPTSETSWSLNIVSLEIMNSRRVLLFFPRHGVEDKKA